MYSVRVEHDRHHHTGVTGVKDSGLVLLHCQHCTITYQNSATHQSLPLTFSPRSRRVREVENEVFRFTVVARRVAV